MQEIKRVCVIGAGAIGSLYAGHLGRVVDVVVLTRRQSHADDLNKNGLRVSGKTECHTRVTASVDPASFGPVDLVIIATKANAVEASAKTMAGHFSGAHVMTVQNGLGCEEVVARYGKWPVISAVTFMSGTRHSDTHVEYELDTATWMGPWAQASASFPDVKQVAALLVKSGLVAEAFPDLLPAQWSKLIFNSGVNSVAAVTNLPHVKAFAERDSPTALGHVLYAMMDEGKRVAAASGVTLHKDPWEMNVRAVGQGQTGAADYAHVPSMLDDVRAHRATEIDFITGAVVRAAAKVGVQVPTSETLYRLVKALETSWK
ncbi:MAG: ketopantoate reductase family protein [Steroidobacteraceae bacterium]